LSALLRGEHLLGGDLRVVHLEHLVRLLRGDQAHVQLRLAVALDAEAAELGHDLGDAHAPLADALDLCPLEVHQLLELLVELRLDRRLLLAVESNLRRAAPVRVHLEV